MSDCKENIKRKFEEGKRPSEADFACLIDFASSAEHLEGKLDDQQMPFQLSQVNIVANETNNGQLVYLNVNPNNDSFYQLMSIIDGKFSLLEVNLKESINITSVSVSVSEGGTSDDAASQSNNDDSNIGSTSSSERQDFHSLRKILFAVISKKINSEIDSEIDSEIIASIPLDQFIRYQFLDSTENESTVPIDPRVNLKLNANTPAIEIFAEKNGLNDNFLERIKNIIEGVDFSSVIIRYTENKENKENKEASLEDILSDPDLNNSKVVRLESGMIVATSKVSIGPELDDSSPLDQLSVRSFDGKSVTIDEGNLKVTGLIGVGDSTNQSTQFLVGNTEGSVSIDSGNLVAGGSIQANSIDLSNQHSGEIKAKSLALIGADCNVKILNGRIEASDFILESVYAFNEILDNSDRDNHLVSVAMLKQALQHNVQIQGPRAVELGKTRTYTIDMPGGGDYSYTWSSEGGLAIPENSEENSVEVAVKSDGVLKVSIRKVSEEQPVLKRQIDIASFGFTHNKVFESTTKSWSLPSDVALIKIELWGAAGGANGDEKSGGRGAYLAVLYEVGENKAILAETKFDIDVGSLGENSVPDTDTVTGKAQPQPQPAKGGGSTYLKYLPKEDEKILLAVAGGGGGRGENSDLQDMDGKEYNGSGVPPSDTSWIKGKDATDGNLIKGAGADSFFSSKVSLVGQSAGARATGGLAVISWYS